LEQDELVVRVGDVMTSSLISIREEEPVVEAAKLMDKNHVFSILVKRGEAFSGMITDRNIISRVVSKGFDPSKIMVREVMTAPLVTIDENATVDDAANMMKVKGVRRLAVERNHKVVGIITESDIIRINPELHFLIRERSKLETRPAPSKPGRTVLAGLCEECGNYSGELGNRNGRWLCEDCRSQ
jgi:CBS domain-containing protein